MDILVENWGQWSYFKKTISTKSSMKWNISWPKWTAPQLIQWSHIFIGRQ